MLIKLVAKLGGRQAGGEGGGGGDLFKNSLLTADGTQITLREEPFGLNEKLINSIRQSDLISSL